MIDCEAARGFPAAVPVIARDGWLRLAEVAPDMLAMLEPLTLDPSPLVAALDTTPQTLVHGDSKLGNLGRHPDGRTILIDWALPGRSVGCLELAHYLALNRARIPAGVHAGGHDRRVPRRARTPRDRHRPVVGPPAPVGAARDHGAARLGEGTRPTRRPRLVGRDRVLEGAERARLSTRA